MRALRRFQPIARLDAESDCSFLDQRPHARRGDTQLDLSDHCHVTRRYIDAGDGHCLRSSSNRVTIRLPTIYCLGLRACDKLHSNGKRCVIMAPRFEQNSAMTAKGVTSAWASKREPSRLMEAKHRNMVLLRPPQIN